MDEKTHDDFEQFLKAKALSVQDETFAAAYENYVTATQFREFPKALAELESCIRSAPYSIRHLFELDLRLARAKANPGRLVLLCRKMGLEL